MHKINDMEETNKITQAHQDYRHAADAIKEEQRQEERRQHRMAFVTTIIVSLLGIAALLYLVGDVLWKSLASICNQPDTFVLVWPTLFCLVFFALLNHWLSRQYRKT